ncbi:hypothetical protein [Pedobacter metabolipauper]|uniref:Uncharacterized protein n=1 Tax=Pedobacter metabolipauper TaxID=425513 RepID=A0A4R6SSU0_9SPHI|nr:hypothetical protein [Pedobacter metabolipauper]TDQ07713.1 hypothetical protein ATK78_3842 [Pedobacter metabolipauper]
MEKLENKCPEAVISLINAHLNAESIFCFDERVAYPDQRKGTFLINRQLQEKTHLYLLVISDAGNKEPDVLKWEINTIQKAVADLHTAISVTLLVHTAQEVAEALRNNERFFSTVIKTSDMIYFKPELQSFKDLVRVKNISDEVFNQIQWQNRCKRADDFFTVAGEVFDEVNGEVTLCQMVMSMEQICLGLIELFLGYRPKFTDLENLIPICDCINEEFEKIMPRTDDHDQEIYVLLMLDVREFRTKRAIDVNFLLLNVLYVRCNRYIEAARALGDAEVNRMNQPYE